MWFGPPRRLTAASSCPWIGHPVSGLLYATIAHLRLGFPSAPVLYTLTSLHTVTRRPVLQKVRGRILLLPLLVNIGFQVLFHSPPGVLFTFPSRYYSAIAHQVVFSLGGWSPRLPTGFLVSCGTPDTRLFTSFSPTGLLPPSVPLSNGLRLRMLTIMRVHTPQVRRPAVWALSISLAATLKIDVSFSSSGYLDVSVHRVPSVTLCIHVTVIRLLVPGFPIRKSMAQSLLTAPHGLSQLTTSFIGSWCQGIHPVLLLA